MIEQQNNAMEETYDEDTVEMGATEIITLPKIERPKSLNQETIPSSLKINHRRMKDRL